MRTNCRTGLVHTWAREVTENKVQQNIDIFTENTISENNKVIGHRSLIYPRVRDTGELGTRGS